MSVISEIRAAIFFLKERQRIYDHIRFCHGDNPELVLLNVKTLEENVQGEEKNLRLDQGLKGFCEYREEVSKLSMSELIWLAKLNLTRSETYLQPIPFAEDEEDEHVNLSCTRGWEHNTISTDLLDKVIDKYRVVSRPRQVIKDGLSRAIEEALEPSKGLHQKLMKQLEAILEAKRLGQQIPLPANCKQDVLCFMEALNNNLIALSLKTEEHNGKNFLKVDLPELTHNPALLDLTSIQLTKHAVIFQSIVSLYLAQMSHRPLPIVKNFVRICLEYTAGAQYLLYLALKKEEMEKGDPNRN